MPAIYLFLFLALSIWGAARPAIAQRGPAGPAVIAHGTEIPELRALDRRFLDCLESRATGCVETHLKPVLSKFVKPDEMKRVTETLDYLSRLFDSSYRESYRSGEAVKISNFGRIVSERIYLFTYRGGAIAVLRLVFANQVDSWYLVKFDFHNRSDRVYRTLGLAP